MGDGQAVRNAHKDEFSLVGKVEKRDGSPPKAGIGPSLDGWPQPLAALHFAACLSLPNPLAAFLARLR
jgi:hypothetical protein